MKNRNLFILFALSALFFSCKDETPSFKFNTAHLKQHHKSVETISLEVLNEKNTTIDSVIYYINNQRIASVKGNSKLEYKLENERFGKKSLKGLVYFGGRTQEINTSIEVVSSIEPKLLTYSILNTYPHDIQAYTQGLEFHNGILYESTGLYNRSSIRKTNHKTGEVLSKKDLESKYFGEGLTILNGKAYQLTWRENTGFIYNPETLEREKTFSYFKNVEGWGLCNDGEKLYFSDGTETIYILDPETLEEIDHINVYTALTKIPGVNEMEWVNGKIFANIYTKDAIAIIDPKTGAVESVIDFSALRSKVTQHDKLDVLNGIAYNPDTKTLFITGKNWDKMFEIKLEE
jgi:glutamine cyclotransferase